MLCLLSYLGRLSVDMTAMDRIAQSRNANPAESAAGLTALVGNRGAIRADPPRQLQLFGIALRNQKRN